MATAAIRSAKSKVWAVPVVAVLVAALSAAVVVPVVVVKVEWPALEALPVLVVANHSIRVVAVAEPSDKPIPLRPCRCSA